MKRYIKTSLGMYWRALETIEFVYYVNYQEGDENACVIMVTKGGTLISNNYFAYGSFFEAIEDKTFTYMSKTMKINYRLHLEANK